MVRVLVSLGALLTSIETWRVSAAMRGEIPGTEWLFPIVETLHVMALTLVLGSVAMADLRLLGLGSRKVSASRLLEEVLPWTWAAWFAAAVFGTLMFLSKAHIYADNLQFQLKFACMGLAALNMAVFHLGPFKHVERWDSGVPPLAARACGALSLTLWVSVAFLGRWVGFTTT